MCFFDGEGVTILLERAAELGGELEQELDADGEVGAIEEASERMSARRGSQPVVPTTMRAPLARQARMFWTAASGVVKSMMTSKPATKGGVSAMESRFSLASRTWTPWPRS